MTDKFFDSKAPLNLQDVFSVQLKPNIDNLKRICPSLSDEDFINAGINRIISENKTGRDFIQKIDKIFNTPIARTTFSDVMHSSRKLELLNQISNLYYKSTNHELSNDGIDYSSEFKEIDAYEIYSVDGHYIEQSSHTERDVKGKLLIYSQYEK